MKRLLLLFLLCGGILVSLSAQAAITRFAVVDMSRVATVYADQLPEAKAFTEKRDKIQAEIEKQNKELQDLKAKLAEAQGSASQIKTLENQVKSKEQAIQNYIKNNFADLERERDRFMKNDNVMTQIISIIRSVAEGEGCSMVLSKDAPGVLWYSPSVDITNKVIERIRASRR